MVEVFLIKNDSDGNPLYKFVIQNYQGANIKPEWPVTPAPLPEEGSDQNVLVKLTGNMLQSGLSWTLKDYDVDQEVLAGALTKTVPQQINFFVNLFQPQSIEDSFQIVFNYPDDPIVYNGFIGSVQFNTMVNSPLTWNATAKFLQGIVIAIYELDTSSTPLNVTATSTTPGEIDMTWTVPADPGAEPIDSYVVQYAILGGAFISEDVGDVLLTTIDSLSTGTYNVRVLAKSTLGLGRPSVLLPVIVA